MYPEDTTQDLVEDTEPAAAVHWRHRLQMAAGVICGGSIFLTIGLVTDMWTRWLAFAIGTLLISLGLDICVLLLPPSRFRIVMRVAVGTPGAILMVLLMAGGTLLNVAMALGLLYGALFLVVAVVGLLFSATYPGTFALPYVVLLLTLVIAAYSGDRVLLPIKWMYRFSRGRGDAVAAEALSHASALIRIINLRRLAYQVAIITYLTSVAGEFAHVMLPGAWQPFSRTAFAALIGFLAVDSYVAAFHPRLIARRDPIRYT